MRVAGTNAAAADPAAPAYHNAQRAASSGCAALHKLAQLIIFGLVFCAAVSTDPLTAGRDHVARYVRELTQRLPRGDKPRIGAEIRRVEGRTDPAHISSSIRRTQ